MDIYGNLVPKADVPLSSFAPFIGFSFAAIPILILVEYFHRPIFTGLLRTTIGARDMLDLKRYYLGHQDDHESKETSGPSAARGPSGIWVFEHKSEVVGVVCLDGRNSGVGLKTVLGNEEGQVVEDQVEALEVAQDQNGKNTTSERDGLRRRLGKGTVEGDDVDNRATGIPGMVQIRHLDVDHPYRRHGIATDLLISALDHAFALETIPESLNDHTTVHQVMVLTNPLSPGHDRVFTKCGFKPSSTTQAGSLAQPQPLGMMKWRGRWLGISREEWVHQRDTLRQP